MNQQYSEFEEWWENEMADTEGSYPPGLAKRVWNAAIKEVDKKLHKSFSDKYQYRDWHRKSVIDLRTDLDDPDRYTEL